MLSLGIVPSVTSAVPFVVFSLSFAFDQLHCVHLPTTFVL